MTLNNSLIKKAEGISLNSDALFTTDEEKNKQFLKFPRIKDRMFGNKKIGQICLTTSKATSRVILSKRFSVLTKELAIRKIIPFVKLSTGSSV